MNTELMVAIERAVAQNLLDYVHAVQSVAPNIGAEALACGGGLAAYMGLGSPLTTMKGAGPEITNHDLDFAESFFWRRGVGQVVFELAPWISERTVERLAKRGYRVGGAEDVVVRSRPYDAPTPLNRVVPINSDAWPELQRRANGVPEAPEWVVISCASAEVRGARRFGSLDSSGACIACAEIFPVGDVALFANDATLPSARGRGAQTALIHHRLRTIATDRFRCVAAEVAPGSVSERNYLRCGFRVAYSRSHYLRAPA